jgi:hypothetical protein
MTKDTEAKWRGRVAEWRGSGMTAEQFAAGRGFEGSTLRFWASRLRHVVDGGSSAPGPAVAMARVVRTAAARPDAGVAVVVGSARVLLSAGFDAEVLREVVAALGCRS